MDAIDTGMMIVTLGSSAALTTLLKQGAKQGAKQGLETTAKNTGKQLAKEFGQEMAERLSKAAGKKLGKNIQKVGILHTPVNKQGLPCQKDIAETHQL